MVNRRDALKGHRLTVDSVYRLTKALDDALVTMRPVDPQSYVSALAFLGEMFELLKEPEQDSTTYFGR